MAIDTFNGTIDPALAGGLLAVLAAFFFVIFVIIVAIYVYTSFAFMKIAQKKKLASPGIAWIPGVGPALIASKIAKMPWWPILLLIGAFIPFIGILFSIAFQVFFIIWNWKMFESFRKPGWWAIFILIFPVYLVFLGIVAWGKN